MTKEQLEQYIFILRAWQEGKPLQIKLSSGEWVDRKFKSMPSHCYEYRIKPEKEKFVVYKYTDQKIYVARKEHWPISANYEFIKEIEIEV